MTDEEYEAWKAQIQFMVDRNELLLVRRHLRRKTLRSRNYTRWDDLLLLATDRGHYLQQAGVPITVWTKYKPQYLNLKES